jgi:hypothetical protein
MAITNMTTTISIADSVSSSMKPSATDGEFLGQIQWTNDADPALVRAAGAGDRTAFWAVISKQVFGLGTRANRRKVHERRCAAAMSLWAATDPSPLAEVWNELGKKWESARDSALSHRTQKKNKFASQSIGEPVFTAIKISRKMTSALADWLESPDSQSPSPREVLILAEMLRMVGKSLPAKLGVPPQLFPQFFKMY